MNNFNKSDFLKMMNLSDSEADAINIDNITMSDTELRVFISKPALPCYCPVCSSRLKSKGFYHRCVTHSIRQDGIKVLLEIDQKKYYCRNCGTYHNEQFPFVDKSKQFSNLSYYLVLEAMKDINASTASIAKRFNMSDHQVHDIFSRYVDLKRLPLPEYISVDEVFLDISNKEKYAFVIMNFVTGEIIDILHNKWKNTLYDYFLKIPLEERKNVKCLISDGYDTYADLCGTVFPNCCHIIDSFHVIQHLLNPIRNRINEVLRRYKQRDENRRIQNNEYTNRDNKTIKPSREVVLLIDYRWVLLKNQDNINYPMVAHYHSKLESYMTTYDIEKEFFALSSDFKTLRDLKEIYIKFNSTNFLNQESCRTELEKIIKIYKKSGNGIFIEFATFLEKYCKSIVRSFITVVVTRKRKKDPEYLIRLSNGPIEGFNKVPKDYKRITRGVANFDYARNRILWATRKNPSILASPKTLAQIHSYHKKK